jgi:hypothetical protein
MEDVEEDKNVEDVYDPLSDEDEDEEDLGF